MLKQGRRAGAQPKFTANEDRKLRELVKNYGLNNWNFIAKQFKNKTAKQCQSRYKNYANPNLSHEDWSEEEDQLLLEKYNEIGPKWTIMAEIFKTRSANDLRYRWIYLNKNPKKEMHTEIEIKDSPKKILLPPIPPLPNFGPLPHLSDKDISTSIFNNRPEMKAFDWTISRDIKGNLWIPPAPKVDHMFSPPLQVKINNPW